MKRRKCYFLKPNEPVHIVSLKEENIENSIDRKESVPRKSEYGISLHKIFDGESIRNNQEAVPLLKVSTKEVHLPMFALKSNTTCGEKDTT